MSYPRNGGPAFPRPASKGMNYVSGEPNDPVDPQKGMTLRQWYAGMALPKCIEQERWPALDANAKPIEGMTFIDMTSEDDDEDPFQWAARMAFNYADAMIAHEAAERSKAVQG